METEVDCGDTNISILNMSKEDLHKKYFSLSKLYSQLQQDSEVKSQQIYDYKRELLRLSTLEAEYLSEIESLQLRENTKFEKMKLKVQVLEEEKNHLKHIQEEQVDNLEQKLMKKEEEIYKLQEEFKRLSAACSSSDYHEIDELRSKISDMKNIEIDRTNEIITLNERIEFFEKQLLLCNEQCNSLKDDYEILNENYNVKKYELNEANAFIETLQEDLMLAKNEIEIVKSIPLQDGSQGNSLFAEVDHKRLEVQEKMTAMKTQYLEMKQERGKLLSQIATLNCNNAMLCQRWESEIKDKERDDDKVYDSYNARIKYLESQLEVYKNEILTRQKISTMKLDSGEIQFVENMLEAKNKEIELLKKESDNFSLSRGILSRQLRDSNIEMRHWRAKAAKLECDVGKLQVQIEELKLKKNNDVLLEPSHCIMYSTNKKSSVQMPTRPTLKEFAESLGKTSPTLVGEDRYSMIDCSRNIKRSLLKEPNRSDLIDSFNDISQNKENLETKEKIPLLVNVEKKVQFVDGTVDNSNTNGDKIRKVGKVILCKPMILKKKC